MSANTNDIQNKIPTTTKLEWLQESANKYISLGDRLRAASEQCLFEYAPDVAEQLANDLHPYVRCNIAIHPDVFSNPKIVEKLSNDKNELVRLNLAKNPNLFKKADVSIIIKLSNDENDYIREQLSKHPDLFTNQYVVRKLSNDKNEVIRANIASHPDLFSLSSCSMIIDDLVNDSSALVRGILASRNDIYTQEHIVECLSKDESSLVKTNLISNKNVRNNLYHIVDKLVDCYSPFIEYTMYISDKNKYEV
jgi:hypothetical protein